MHYIIPIICFAVIVGLLWDAYKDFYRPFQDVLKTMETAIGAIESIIESKPTASRIQNEIDQNVMISPILKHLWSEYCETLHPQKVVDEYGSERVDRYRATAMAEMYFTEQALVDSPLKTEYFKNLPGILTGIGIIGTFGGLIWGLHGFQVSSDPALVRSSLRNLISAVALAFIVSCIAIIFAMLFTWYEKRKVAECYELVETLCQKIDSLFDAGANEEYLARLVVAAESSATEAAQIKDSLVSEFRQIMADVTNLQIEASRKHTAELSDVIGRKISENLEAPFAKITSVVQMVGANQGDAVNSLLTDVLASFSNKMEDMFGGQLHGISDLLVESSNIIKTASLNLNDVAANLSSAGAGAAEAMGDKLNSAIEAMAAKQEAMNEQMAGFVSQMRGTLEQTQENSVVKMHEALDGLTGNIGLLLEQVGQQIRSSNDDVLKTNSMFIDAANHKIGETSDMTQALLVELRNASETIKSGMEAVSNVSVDSVARMNSGAEVLYQASCNFAEVGNKIRGVLGAAENTTKIIRDSSEALSRSLADAKRILLDNEHARDSVSAMLQSLDAITSNAKQEAAMTSGVLKTLREASEQLNAAQTEAEDYLRQITEVMGKVHEEFASNISSTLAASNTTFHREVDQAVQMLSGAIQGLGDALESLPVSGRA